MNRWKPNVNDCEALDTKPASKPVVTRLHTARFRNFLVEHGNMKSDRRCILHFAKVRCEPDRFLQMLKRAFVLDCRIVPEVSQDSGVILGGFRELGVQDIAYSVLWKGEIPDAFLLWIKRKVQELDKALG